MKIAISRKDGKIFYCGGKNAEEILSAFRSNARSTVVCVDGENFSIGEIKGITDMDFKESNQIGKSCGKCRDGFLDVLADKGDKIIPCDCDLGNRASSFINEYKNKVGLPSNPYKILKEYPPTSNIQVLQDFKDKDKQYSEIKDELMKCLKEWTKHLGEQKNQLKEYYFKICDALKERGLELETQFYGK